jgi:hypothetical protein
MTTGLADAGPMVGGHDFVDDDSTPQDGTGHGTAVGSMINAATDNGAGMASVAPGASLVHARVLDDTGRGYASDIAAGMDYVADQGAKIVNVSIGGGKALVEQQVIEAHPDVLFVVAAGNAAQDNDVPAQATYPCAEAAANVLCVGATTSGDTMSSFSSWGRSTVDLMAPGSGVHGLTRSGGVAAWNGTSFSSPLTAGAAALLKSAMPSASAAQLKAAIMSSATPVPALAGRSVTGGRLDARSALAALAAAPAAPAPTPSTSRLPAPAPAPAPAPMPDATPDGAPAPSISGTTPTPAGPTARGTLRGRVRIAGTPRVGRTIVARAPALRAGATVVRYQWSVCDRRGKRCVAVRGATGRRLAIRARMAGHRLRVRVTAVAGEVRVTRTSAPTRRITPRG